MPDRISNSPFIYEISSICNRFLYYVSITEFKYNINSHFDEYVSLDKIFHQYSNSSHTFRLDSAQFY